MIFNIRGKSSLIVSGLIVSNGPKFLNEYVNPSPASALTSIKASLILFFLILSFVIEPASAKTYELRFVFLRKLGR